MEKQKGITMKKILAGLFVMTACTLFGETGGESTVTFETKGKSKVHWSTKWQAQGLAYPDGAVVEKIRAVFKDGMENNRAKIEFYKEYDGAGTFSGLLGSEVFTISKPNNGATYTFSSPVELLGAADGIYYMKLSPAEGGVVHGLYCDGDDGSDPLRHGSSGGIAYFSNRPKGLGNEMDLGALTVYTQSLSKEAVLKTGKGLVKEAATGAPTQTKVVDACESFSKGKWWVAGTEMSIETSPELVREGTGSLKIVYPIDMKQRRWIGPTKHSVNMKKPKQIIFWVRPEESTYIAPQLIDSDGTQLGMDVADLKPGKWNLVIIKVEDMGMSKKGKDGVFSDLKRLTFAVHAAKGFAESRDYIYYFDNIVMLTDK